MEYFGNTLCISARELVDSGIMTQSNYCQMVARKKVTVARRGGGSNGYALVAVSSLPTSYKDKVLALYPDPSLETLYAWLEANYEIDQEAVVYFERWKTKCGSETDLTEHVTEYVTNASVLNACIRLYNNAKAIQKTMGQKYDWSKMAQAVEGYRVKTGHTLPTSMLRFRKKVNEYQKDGYSCLISGKFGNQSSRKVTHQVEMVVVGIAIQPNKPFNSSVWEMYNAFICGEYEVYSPETGELFNPDDFVDKNGEPLSLSESTICNILNKPKNRALIAHALDDWETFMHEQRPHVHRHDGMFSLSQITADDVDLTRKMGDTKKRVHAYYMYDDLSQCVIGAAYSRTKDQRLIVDCFRDMFRLLEKNGWGMPAGIEVENHLMSEYKDGFLRAGEAFSFVRYCAPLNSQEKRAESLNGAKKRSIIHKNHEGIGRFYGKGKWRMKSNKVSDAENDTYEDKKYYTYEELVADDRADNLEWNNSLHPNQKKYPGMTRWQVLVANINPTLKKMDRVTLSRYIGECVPTTIRRNSTVRVCYEDWWLSGPEVLEKLNPNDYKVNAYYIPDENGKPVDVYLFQGEKYIDQIERVETFNRVMAEQTDEDVVKFIEQQKKIAQFDRYIRENAIPGLKVGKKVEPASFEDEVVVLPALDDFSEDSVSYHVPSGIECL